VQIVEEIYDAAAAEAMGLKEGYAVIMIHTGSRGFGYQVADEFVNEMRARKGEEHQMSYAAFGSELGQRYLHAMGNAANFAWCNRQVIMHFARESLRAVFPMADLQMDLVYDVAHNIAKIERHEIDGVEREFVVHRKGATRAFGPGSLEIPEKYREVGQPVLIGGSMGTASYVLAGNGDAAQLSFGSTCHGAGRAMSRTRASHAFKADRIKKMLADQGIEFRAVSKETIVEEAPETYKDIDQVVEACQTVGISRKVARLVPLGVIKG
jgi:tRNA-splicing ligase RtcB